MGGCKSWGVAGAAAGRWEIVGNFEDDIDVVVVDCPVVSGEAFLELGSESRYLRRRSSLLAVGDEGDRRPRGNDVDPSVAVERLTRDCGGERFDGGYRLDRDEVPW